MSSAIDLDWHDTTSGPQLRQKQVEVHLDGGAVRGNLITPHRELNVFLQETEETFTLTDAAVVSSRSQDPITRQSTVFLNTNEVLFAIDLTPEEAEAQPPRETYEVAVNIGTHWIRGWVYIVVGGELRSYFDGQTMRFMPVIDGVLNDRTDGPARTFLINRSKINAMTVLGVGELVAP